MADYQINKHNLKVVIINKSPRSDIDWVLDKIKRRENLANLILLNAPLSFLSSGISIALTKKSKVFSNYLVENQTTNLIYNYHKYELVINLNKEIFIEQEIPIIKASINLDNYLELLNNLESEKTIKINKFKIIKEIANQKMVVVNKKYKEAFFIKYRNLKTRTTEKKLFINVDLWYKSNIYAFISYLEAVSKKSFFIEEIVRKTEFNKTTRSNNNLYTFRDLTDFIDLDIYVIENEEQYKNIVRNFDIIVDEKIKAKVIIVEYKKKLICIYKNLFVNKYCFYKWVNPKT